jgi:2-polyprenyl-3-methyl-5-hydroxy-6-metoxy-1,4-benzoquinol methylase
LQFEKGYFKGFQYSQRERLIKRHVLEVLRWGSSISDFNLLNGYGKRALDIGCAYGYAVDILRSLGYDSYGIDVSKYSIEQAKKKISPADFAVCDVQKGLPFKNRVFDLITCFEVLEHLTDPIRSIQNMYGSCRNTMVCTTPNKVVEKPIKKILRDFDKTHINVRTPQEWEKCLYENLQCSAVKVESFFDVNLRVKDKLLFFKSLKVPCFGLDIRILIENQGG